MNELKIVEGVAESVNGPSEKGSGGIKVGGVWHNLSREEYRGVPWAEPNKGDTVRLGLAESNGREYVKTIALLAKAPEQNGSSPAGESRSEFRSPSQIIRTEALRIASDALCVRAPQDYDLTAFSSAVIVLAGEYADFIENGLS